jgi:hypothetical protein
MSEQEKAAGKAAEGLNPAAEAEEATTGGAEADETGGAAKLPPLDYSTFILSLSSSVLMSLGVVENPVTQKVEEDHAQARQTIDLIELLKEKTKGNLTDTEAKLTEDVLYELRLWYCKKTS